MSETIDYADSYRRMVATRKEKHGEDTYAEAGRKTTVHGFTDPRVRRRASLKRWHKSYFNDKGQLKPEYQHLLEENE